MPEARTLPIPIEHREFTVKVDGTAIEREHQLLAVYIIKAANKIASAKLVYLDGAAASSDFPLSNTDRFIPGQAVEILAGAGDAPISLFQGIVVRQSLKIRDHTAPQLVVECRHAAVKLTVARNSAYFFDQTDSEMMETLLERGNIPAEIEDTTVRYQQQVQYDATDWDFLLTRAEANGKLVFTNDDRVTVKAPALAGSPVCTLQFGATILELDAAIEARHQYSAVTSFTWDASQQRLLDKAAEDVQFTPPGNLSREDLANVVGLNHYPLRHIALQADEAQTWANAQWLKSALGQVSGRIKCEGISTIHPGDTISLSGVGDRYSGKVYVTGVRQDFDLVQGWKTHIQFGSVENWFAADPSISAPKAAALLPGMNGLQIGIVTSNEDPDGEYRVRVRMPLVNDGEEGTWARIATLDAGKERGTFFRPEIGDEVILGCLNDDPRQAVILGMVHSSANPAPVEASDANPEKLFQSRSKLKLYFNDEKKVMQLATPAGNKMILSEDEQAIVLQDQHNNKIVMNQDGITIESSQAIGLKAGTEITVESGTALNLQGGTQLKLEGTSGVELTSTAITKVKGSLIQLN
ncbi:type VI secretion system tip protein VgrG [Pantanalinema sp. GBBB05]|uniref:type VI secretion system tip protein VgrG n=1 Tax=Pantanalinema sp. GBBB05 TaxID=2604139 RepID=UPI001DB87FE0|nr:type VI secretion system tip protein VgrG [Pantanalinema sp. GBBB05]